MRIPRYISPSALKDIESCPFKYYCKKMGFAEIQLDDSKRQFGLSGHKIYEEYFKKLPDFVDKDIIIKAIEESIAEYGSAYTDSRKKSTKKFRNYLLNFELNRIKSKIPKPDVIEKEFRAKIFDDLPPLLVRTDLFVVGTGTVIDWKFGNNGEMSDDLLIQGKMNELVLNANGLNVKHVSFRYPVLGTKNDIPSVSDEWIHKKLVNMISTIESGVFESKPNILCKNWCPFILRCKYRNTCVWSI
jgi:hypothetical protein